MKNLTELARKFAQTQARERLEHEARRQRALQKIYRLREDLRAKAQKEQA